MATSTTQPTAEQTREAAIRENFPIPEDVRRHAVTANYDLYFGPYAPDHWQEEENDPKQPPYSFSASLDAFAEWVRNLRTVYYAPDSGTITDTEPAGEYWREDPDTGELVYTGDPDSEERTALDEAGIEWNYSEPEPYWEIDAGAVAEAYGYGTLLTYA